MIYTVQPLPPVTYSGAIVWAIGCLCFVLLMITMDTLVEGDIRKTLKSFHIRASCVVFAALSACGIAMSVFMFDNTQPLNQQTVATKVTTTTHAVKHGKYGIREGAYVVYEVPEGEVGFSTGSGVVWPDQIVLYRQR